MHIRGQMLNEQIYQYIIVISGVSHCPDNPARAAAPRAPALTRLQPRATSTRRRIGPPHTPPTPPAHSQSVGFLYGAYMEDFGYCVYAWFAGCCLACLVSPQPLPFAPTDTRRRAPLASAHRRTEPPPPPPQQQLTWTSPLCAACRSASQSGASSTAIRRSGWIRRCWRCQPRRNPSRSQSRSSQRRTRRQDEDDGGFTRSGGRMDGGQCGVRIDLRTLSRRWGEEGELPRESGSQECIKTTTFLLLRF